MACERVVTCDRVVTRERVVALDLIFPGFSFNQFEESDRDLAQWTIRGRYTFRTPCPFTAAGR